MNSLAPIYSPTRNAAADPRQGFLAIGSNWMPTVSVDAYKPIEGRFALLPKRQAPLVEDQLESPKFEERLFDALVSLKVSVSIFAMHLDSSERQRIFDELDDIVNIEDWHEGDKLPSKESFQQFLKWMIYSQNADWTSIGVSDVGTILVAWRKPRVLLTADFEGKDSVRWTAKLSGEDGEVGHTAGRCPLKLFAEQAQFYLRR